MIKDMRNEFMRKGRIDEVQIKDRVNESPIKENITECHLRKGWKAAKVFNLWPRNVFIFRANPCTFK